MMTMMMTRPSGCARRWVAIFLPPLLAITIMLPRVTVRTCLCHVCGAAGAPAGWIAFQTALVNLTTALGLLSVAVLLTDFCMTSCCPLRHIYKQYKERETIDFSDLR